MEAEAYVMRGDDSIKNGDLQSAIENYTQAIELKKDYAEAYSKRGSAYLRKHDCENAIKDFSQVIDLKPNDAEAYSGRGEAYRAIDGYVNAIADQTKAIELTVSTFNFHRDSYIRNSKYYHPELYSGLPRSVALAYRERGVTHLWEHEYESAIKDFTAVFVTSYSSIKGINSKTLELRDFCDTNWIIGLYHELSAAYQKMGDWSNAISNLEYAIRQTNQKSDFEKAFDYLKYGDYDSALEAFQRVDFHSQKEAIALVKSKIVFDHIKSGDAYRDKGDYKTAADTYKKALELAPLASGYVESGNTYYSNGDYKSAGVEYKKALEFDPIFEKKKQKYLENGNAYFRKGDYENAVKYYERAFQHGLDNADAKRDSEAAKAEIARLKAKQMGAKAGKKTLSGLLGLLVGAIIGAGIGAIAALIFPKFAGAGDNVELIRLIGVGGGAALGAIIGMIAGIFGDASYKIGGGFGGLIALGCFGIVFFGGQVKGVGSFISYALASGIIGGIFFSIFSVIGLIAGAVAGAIVKKK
jgi:tetratricopeptide (TPR) repeat protein